MKNFLLTSLLFLFMIPFSIRGQDITIERGQTDPLSVDISDKEYITLELKGWNPLIYKFIVNSKDSARQPIVVPNSFKGFDPSSLLANLVESIIAPLKEGVQTNNTDYNILQDNFETSRPTCEDTLRGYLQFNGLRNDSFPEANNHRILCDLITQFEKSSLITDDIKDITNQLNLLYNDTELLAHTWEYDSALVTPLTSFSTTSVVEKLSAIETNINRLTQQIKDTYTKREIHSSSKAKYIVNHMSGLISSYKTLKDKLEKKIDGKSLGQLMAAVKNYSENESYVSLPIQIRQGDKKVSIEIIPYDDNYAAPIYKTDLLLKHKSPVNFSFGGGFYISTLYDKNYHVKANEDSTFTVVPEVEISKFSFGINTLVHANFNDFQFGIGPTLAFRKKIIPGIAVGLGYIIGNPNKIAITAGFNLGFVKRKSPVIELGTRYLEKPAEITTDKTDIGFFVSVNYSFLDF